MTPDPKPLPTRRVADREQIKLVLDDLALLGHAFVDERGRRLDPAALVLSPDGRTATDGTRLFRPTGLDPARVQDRRALAAARLRLRACAACGRPAGGVHHVVQKGAPHFGDDACENLVGLCGSGSDGCHGAFHGSPYVAERPGGTPERRDARWVATRVGEHLIQRRPDAVRYVIDRIGEPAAWDFLRRTYHVDLS